MKKTLLRAVALTATLSLSSVGPAFSGGSIGHGDFSVYDQNGLLSTRLTGHNPLEDEALLVCDGKCMIKSEGIGQIDINDRRWSHYIAGAESLIRNYPIFHDAARKQIDERTANFLEAHDLKTYVAANRREWHDLHEMLSGRKMNPAECLPYVFDKLVE